MGETRRLPLPAILGAGSVLLVAGVAIGFRLADQAASDLVDQVRPDLETMLSKPLGHPIKIGAYQGLRPWGFQIGPSRILPAAADRSEISLEKLTVSVDPLASLRQWRPVVQLQLHGTKVQLRRGADGAYWVPGTTDSNQSLPNIGLRYRLVQPAQIRVAPLDQTFELQSRGAVELGDQWFSTQANLLWRDRGGSVRLEARGRWDQPELAVRAQLKQMQLERIALFAPLPSQTTVDGQLKGDLRLQLRRGQFGCQGDVELSGLELKSDRLVAPLRSKQLKLACDGPTLSIRKGNFNVENWLADASGSIRLGTSFNLAIKLRNSSRADKLTIRANGPWAAPQWQLNGTVEPPEGTPIARPIDVDATLITPWLDPEQRGVALKSARLKSEEFRLGLEGEVFPALNLRSTELTANPKLWSGAPPLNSVLGQKAAIQGSLLATGSVQQPAIQLRLNQSHNPLLDRWNLLAEWSLPQGIARLKRFESQTLTASAQLPVALEGGTTQIGDLSADLALQNFSLQRLTPLLGTPTAGTISTSGRLSGPLEALRADLSVQLNQPRFGPLAIPEQWRGRLRGVLGDGATLEMATTNPLDVPGTLRAELTAEGWPSLLELTRQRGTLRLTGTNRRYRWQANQFSLEGLQVALPPQEQFESISGQLSGEGEVAVDPMLFSGEVVIDQPMALGVDLNRIELTGRISNGRFKADGLLKPPEGNVVFKTSGRIGGPLLSEAEAEGISIPWLVAQTRQLRSSTPDPNQTLGRADDLGRLVIETFGGSLDDHLEALSRSKTALKVYDEANPRPRFNPAKLRGRVDAALNLKGPRPSELNLDLQARGHLWLEGEDADQMLQMEPIQVVSSGSLVGGEGQFSILHLPFSLFALFANVPPALKGSVGLIGRYRFDGEGPVVSSEVVLENAALGDDSLVLDRQELTLGPEGISLDLALRNVDSAEPISLRGTIPYRTDDDLNLTLESHGDALTFLSQLAGDVVDVKKGTTDLRLILRGSVSAPQANGFLVVRNGDILLSGQRLHRINAAMVFDFNRLEVQTLTAEMGEGGTLRGMGAIGLFEARSEDKPLTLDLSKNRIRQSIVDVMAEGKVVLQGSLLKPILEGELTLNQGVIRPRQSMLSRVRGGFEPGRSPGIRSSSLLPGAQQPERVTLDSLIEEDWDFKTPLVLFGPGGTAKPSPTAQAFLPNIPVLQFRNFRLKLGPDLAVRMPPIINFRGGGQLLLNGPLDPSLEARGLIRLNRGRISMFSTTFRLDHRSANVAVFTPSLGLIPYVDIAMKTQVSDSVRQGSNGGVTSGNVFETNGLGTMGAGGGQLRLVKVTVQATGPADRLPGNLSLQSSPPMSQSQLLSLIGGNSLAGLAGGGAGTALATVVGQSLLSPVLGTLTDVMGDRLQVALYPTYVTPSVKSEQERTSGRVPPTFTVVSEISADISDNFDFSVLAAPNNSDVPPQASVSYRVNPNTTLSGSVDTDGTWQTQLRVFFRF